MRRMAPAGQIGNVVTVAGWANLPGERDANWLQAQFNDPYGVAVGPDGNIYVADFSGQTIRKITPTGLTTTLTPLEGRNPRRGRWRSSAAIFPPRLASSSTRPEISTSPDSGNRTIRKISPERQR